MKSFKIEYCFEGGEAKLTGQSTAIFTTGVKQDQQFAFTILAENAPDVYEFLRDKLMSNPDTGEQKPYSSLQIKEKQVSITGEFGLIMRLIRPIASRHDWEQYLKIVKQTQSTFKSGLWRDPEVPKMLDRLQEQGFSHDQILLAYQQWQKKQTLLQTHSDDSSLGESPRRGTPPIRG